MMRSQPVNGTGSRGTAYADAGLCESKMHSKQERLGITRTEMKRESPGK